MVGDFDPEQIVTAADNDNADKDGETTYDGELSNWRIQGKNFISLWVFSFYFEFVKSYNLYVINYNL